MVFKKNGLNYQLLVVAVFIVLLLVTVLLVFFVRNGEQDSLEITTKPQQEAETPNLYGTIKVERDQRGLARGRFVKLENYSLYVEFYYRYTGEAAIEAMALSDKTTFYCEERYYTTSDGTKIDKLGAMTQSDNYNGEYSQGGLGADWFKKEAKYGEAVEVRFLGDGQERIPAQVLLYKDKC